VTYNSAGGEVFTLSFIQAWYSKATLPYQTYFDAGGETGRFVAILREAPFPIDDIHIINWRD
jgi:hypothetical protein